MWYPLLSCCTPTNRKTTFFNWSLFRSIPVRITYIPTLGLVLSYLFGLFGIYTSKMLAPVY